jgi:hypothetical protein
LINTNIFIKIVLLHVSLKQSFQMYPLPIRPWTLCVSLC